MIRNINKLECKNKQKLCFYTCFILKSMILSFKRTFQIHVKWKVGKIGREHLFITPCGKHCLEKTENYEAW